MRTQGPLGSHSEPVASHERGAQRGRQGVLYPGGCIASPNVSAGRATTRGVASTYHACALFRVLQSPAGGADDVVRRRWMRPDCGPSTKASHLPRSNYKNQRLRLQLQWQVMVLSMLQMAA